MNLSNRQKMLLHVAASAAGADEAERRLVQQNVGGFYSAADKAVTREGFIAVMAFWEQRAGGTLDRFTEGYWQGQDAKANPTDAVIHRIRTEAAALGLTPEQLDAFAAGKHMSNGRYQRLDQMPAYWLRKCLQALVEIRRRRGKRTA